MFQPDQTNQKSLSPALRDVHNFKVNVSQAFRAWLYNKYCLSWFTVSQTNEIQ
jgi:hypothetical protein